MSLEKKDRVLLIKLLYENGGDLTTAFREYRSLNCLRKSPMSRQVLKKMIQKFHETGDLSVRRERGRKRISNETAEEVASVVVERESSSQYCAPNTRMVLCDLSPPPLVYTVNKF